MKNFIFCSFGKDSMATVILAHLHKIPVDALVYCEVMFDEKTSAEVPEHAEFIHETAIPRIKKDFGFPVEIIHADETYIDLFHKPISRGNRAGLCRGSPICQGCWVLRDLKLKPMQRFQAEAGDYRSYVGIASDEENRLQRLAGGQKVSLLDQLGYAKQDILRLDEEYDLLSPIYEFAPRNGCLFCPNAKEPELWHLRQHHPDIWQRLLELEQTPNAVKKTYNRDLTLADIEANFSVDDRQIKFDI